MVLVIKNIEEVAVEWMNVFNFGEAFEDVGDFFVESLLTELNLTHVKGSDSTDCITWMYDGGCFSLCF